MHIRPLSVPTLSRPPCTPTTSMTSSASSNASNSCPTSSDKDSLPSQILPHLFVGEQAQTNSETVNKLNIKYILSLGLLPLITTATSSKSNSACSSRNQSPSSSSAQSPEARQATNCDSTLSPSSPTSHLPVPSTSSVSPPLSPAQISECQSLNLDDQLLPSRNSSKDFQICLDQDNAEVLAPEAIVGSTTQNLDRSAFSNDESDKSECKTDSSTNPTEENLDEDLSEKQSDSKTDTKTSGCKFFTRKQRVRGETKAAKLVRSIRCKCINIADNSEQMLAKFFDEAHQFIDEARRKKCNILVHCLAGISRSPTFAIAYLMRVNSLRLEDAYRMVKQRRPQIDPNLNSIGQLMVYEKSLDERER